MSEGEMWPDDNSQSKDDVTSHYLQLQYEVQSLSVAKCSDGHSIHLEMSIFVLEERKNTDFHPNVTTSPEP